MKVKIYMHDERQDSFIKITGQDKPGLEKEVLENWQNIIDLSSEITGCLFSMILKARESGLEVFLTSNSDNSCFISGDLREYGHGIFCESVMGRGEEVFIPNAGASEVWQESPDVRDGYLAYFGMPLLWPDGEFFGILSVFNDKPTSFSKQDIKLLNVFKRAVETDLSLAVEKTRTAYLSDYDPLTNIYNRKALIEKLNFEFDRYQRSKQKFSVLVIDIDTLEAVNEKHGREKGDEILIDFTTLINSLIRHIDFFGRWGDDDFVVICPDTNLEGANSLAEKIVDSVNEYSWTDIEELECTIGCATVNIFDQDVKELIRRADVDLYEKKAQ